MTTSINNSAITLGTCSVTGVTKSSTLVKTTTVVNGDSSGAAKTAVNSSTFTSSLSTALQADSTLKTYVGSSSVLEVSTVSATIGSSTVIVSIVSTFLITFGVLFMKWM